MPEPTFTEEELLNHPEWSPCPLCGEMITIGASTYYYNAAGEYRYVPDWTYFSKKSGGKAHYSVYKGETGYCYPERDMTVPEPPWWLMLLKWIIR